MRDAAFANARRAALARWEAARARGMADERARGAVEALNAHPDLFTTSSCSGRVQLLALPRPGMKQAARVLGRWHDAPSAEALRAALEVRPAERHAWLLLQAPILHVAARDLAAARALLLLGHAAGLKASHVRSFGPAGRVTVELAGTARVECPVAGPELATSAEHVALLARGAPGLLALGHARLDALAERARISSVGGAASHPGPIRAVQGSAENR